MIPESDGAQRKKGTEAPAKTVPVQRPDLDAERVRRLEAERLNGGLARKACDNCATVGAWEVYDRERSTGRVRYIRCKGCGHCDQIPVAVEDVK